MSPRRRTGSVKAAAKSTNARAGGNTLLRDLARQMSQAGLAGRSGIPLQQVRLVRAFGRIEKRDVRRSIVALVEIIAARCVS